jgi:hypothetical protein
MPFNQREFLQVKAGGLAASAVQSPLRTDAATPQINAVAFAAFPIVDPRPGFGHSTRRVSASTRGHSLCGICGLGRGRCHVVCVPHVLGQSAPCPGRSVGSCPGCGGARLNGCGQFRTGATMKRARWEMTQKPF